MERIEPVIRFLRDVGGVLFDGFGGINVTGIESAMRVYGVPEKDRGWLLRQIIIYCGARNAGQSSPGNKG